MAGALCAVVCPERDVGGLQGAMNDAGPGGLDRVPVHGVLQPGGERGHHLVGIVAGPVEPPVHPPLHRRHAGGQPGPGAVLPNM